MQRTPDAEAAALLQSSRVHVPDRYGIWLAENIDFLGAETGCDLTAGSGFHALHLASAGIPTIAIDINPHAVALTRRNASLLELGDLVEARCGDLYSVIHPSERFDCLVAWPPVMPTPPGLTASGFWATANNGGPDGRSVLDRVVEGAAANLTRHGSLWTVHPWYLDLSKTARLAAEAGLEVEVRASKSFPMGATSGSRLGYLRSLGITPQVVDGKPRQDYLVLRLSMPDRN